MTQEAQRIREQVARAVAQTKITDMHTHIYAPEFGDILLWGIDELLVYHYMVSEYMRWDLIPYDKFWAMPKREQADLIWKTIFVDRSPISESARGVLASLAAVGLDVSSRDLQSYREFFAGQKVEDYVNRVFDIENIESVIMTNDPFDDLERPTWEAGKKFDPRFKTALRMDALLMTWPKAVPRLMEWGYKVSEDFSGETIAEVRRYLTDWIERMDAVYMAVSLPPTFAFPEDSARGRLVADCVLPVAAETGKPFAMMIGVKKLTNPDLGLAGDSVGKGSIDTVEYLCASYPKVKFLVTMLARENQHELCVAARKFRNLHVFGCWWFTNMPMLIDEITRMRFELLGLSFTPQHSDARVLDQLIYKWAHSKTIITDVLAEKYIDIAATGWQVSEGDIRRDVAGLFGGNFWAFINS
jgi:hypothetical protein